MQEFVGLLYKIDTSRLLPLHNVLLLQVMQSNIKQRIVYILSRHTFYSRDAKKNWATVLKLQHITRKYVFFLECNNLNIIYSLRVNKN